MARSSSSTTARRSTTITIRGSHRTRLKKSRVRPQDRIDVLKTCSWRQGQRPRLSSRAETSRCCAELVHRLLTGKAALQPELFTWKRCERRRPQPVLCRGSVELVLPVGAHGRRVRVCGASGRCRHRPRHVSWRIASASRHRARSLRRRTQSRARRRRGTRAAARHSGRCTGR